MTLALLGNAGKANSTVAAPTSIAPALSSGSTAGNLLVLVVAATGSSTPTIVPPVNWTVAKTGSVSGLALSIFSFPNNPGGITSVSVTLSSTATGGAVASIFEFSGIGPSYGQVDNNRLQIVSGTGTAVGNSFNPNGTLLESNCLFFYVIARVATAAFTSGLDSYTNWSSSQQATASTGATINVQIDNYWGAPSEVCPTPTSGGTLGASVSFVGASSRFLTTNSYPLTMSNVGGAAGIVVPKFHQGMIGG